MALTNVQIFEMTPKTDCKECGSSNCMHFSYKVCQGILDISACPYISKETLDVESDKTVQPIDMDKSKKEDMRYRAEGKISCPDCKNNIEEYMNFCPFCGKKISKEKEDIEQDLISDADGTRAAFLEKGQGGSTLYDQNENDVIFQEESLDEPVFISTGEDIVCPNCGNDIEEGMTFCPYCDEEISKYEMHIEEDHVSNITETNEPSQEKILTISAPSDSDETSAIFAKGSELVDFYDQNENDVTFQEESLDEAVFISASEDIVCPNCGNDIEKGMITCPFCDEKIPEQEEIVKEKSVSDINEINEARVHVTHTLHEICEKKKISERPISSGVDDDNGTLQEKNTEEPAHSSPDVDNVAFQNESQEARYILASSVYQNANDKEISEVFTSSDRDKIRVAFEKALVAIYKIEDALSIQEKFDQEKDTLAKKKQEMAEEISGVQALIILSIIPFAIILFVIFYASGEAISSSIAGALFYDIGYCLIAYPIYKFIGFFTSISKGIEADKWYNEQIIPLNQKEDEFQKEFKAYCESDEFIFVQKIVPEEYFDSGSVQYFIKILNNGRADTYKEVINLYEEHLHREKMENMQMKSLTLQGENLEETRQLAQNVKAQNEQLQKQTEYMKEISKNTKSTARAVKVNAFIGAVSGHGQSKKLKRIEKNTR